ncbi:phage/plasmid primase, P4 family [Streptomyces canus]|uniref:phage/plasmid primase, P4 family n=1 Tax=Streptomyces canus TaxID=58343 RepID=UPI00324A0119
MYDTFGDDAEGQEMIDFLHLLLGYSITGDVGAQVLPFLHGHGKNGKSVLLDVMIQILGDYADAAPPGFLMDRGAFSEHSTELTELHGRRLIVCSELKPNDKFDEARIRLLTGGDKIKARRMRQDYFSFSPTHHLWLSPPRGLHRRLRVLASHPPAALRADRPRPPQDRQPGARTRPRRRPRHPSVAHRGSPPLPHHP